MEIKPCPFCGIIPIPYNFDAYRHNCWYLHCLKEDDHYDYLEDSGKVKKYPNLDTTDMGAYGELNPEKSIELWNNYVDTFPKEILKCYDWNCHQGLVYLDWGGARHWEVPAGVNPCPSCNEEEWNKVRKENEHEKT